MKKRIITILFVLLVVLIGCTSFASAESTIDYQIYGTQDYAAAQEVLAQLNMLRAQNGLHPLTLDPTLTSIAMQRAAECSVMYDHIRPDNSNFDSIIRSNSAFQYGLCGENIAAGYGNPSAVMNGWINSEGHYANMVKGGYYSVGIGCFYQNDGTKYWAQVFHSARSNSIETNRSIVTKSNINIHSAMSNCDLRLEGYGDCAVNLYEGVTTQPRLFVKNVGWSYGSNTYLSGGYSLRSQNTTRATTSGLKVTGVSPGSVNIDFVFNSGYIPIPYNIIEKPTLSYKFDNYGDIILTLNGYLDTTTNDVKIYFKESKDDLWTVTNINNSNLNYTITNTYYGEVYTCVAQYYDNTAGKWVQVSDPIVIKKRLSTPKINVSTLASSGKPKVTWNAVKDADKYEVWRKVGANGTYKKMYVTTKTSYTNKTAVAGTKYYYKVRAIYENNSKGNSLYSSPYAISCDLPAPTNVKVITVSSTGKPKVTWDAVDGASKYEVWRKAGANGEYKKFYITTGTSYTNKTAVAGIKYYYKVKAIHGSNANANSAFSYAYAVTCDLAAPTNVKVTLTSTGKPKLTWNAVDGASKYEVWRKVGSNGEYKKYYITTKTTLNNTSAVKGVKYYYKIKAIYGSNANANSAFSIIVVKTSK